MKPQDFKDFVYNIARKIDFPTNKIILGGDHLGPLICSHETESIAMSKAIDLVQMLVKDGFKIIHLVTSMPLADD